MEENFYMPKEFIVFGEILKAPSHLRELSRRTGINPMTIKKITDRFVEKNILDFKEVGKNKVFFFKENLESRDMRVIYEAYKKLEAVKKFPILREIFEKIEKDKEVHLAILFGSYAKDRVRRESDIDIYVKTTKVSLKKKIENINSDISVKIGKLEKDNPLTKEVMENHIIIKGSEEYYSL